MRSRKDDNSGTASIQVAVRVAVSLMQAAACALALLVDASQAQGVELRLKTLARPPYGRYAQKLLLADTDHDSLGEVIFHTNFQGRMAWMILEYRPVNRYEVVKCDTGTQWAPDSIVSGNFYPSDVGDVDSDGKADLVGSVICGYNGVQKAFLCTIESRSDSTYPDSLNWVVIDTEAASSPTDRIYTDLDSDGRREILTALYYSSGVCENVADNRESLVYRDWPGGPRTWGDFDQNGKRDFVCHWFGREYIVECSGDNRFQTVCSLTAPYGNVTEHFVGHDADQNGRPEFFVVYAEPGGMGYQLYLYQYEAVAEHDYASYVLDTISVGPGAEVGMSLCSDVDGDGVEEIVWAGGTYILILKATGPHQYRQFCYWWNHDGWVTYCNAADFNGNGYPEVYVGGDALMSVLEVEAVKVVHPDTTRHLTAGDTCEIRWQVYTPPRCDSVSLFLRSDSSTVNGFYRLDTIAHGLSPSESTYSWVVPDTTLDSARILAIAYGPGWQFDESDSALRIAPAGVAGPRIAPPRNWSLSVSPNPARGALRVSYDVPRQCRVLIGVYDVDGRLVRTLAGGVLTAGWYQVVLTPPVLPAGVYYVRLDNGDSRITRKVVLTD
jgi:hypothetical protein